MDTMREDRFTFMPEEERAITDPDELDSIYKKTGGYPLPPQEQAWISEEGCRRWADGDFVSTDELRAEYHKRKAQGKI